MKDLNILKKYLSRLPNMSLIQIPLSFYLVFGLRAPMVNQFVEKATTGNRREGY